MTAWSDIERESPEIAQAGKRRMVGDDGIAIAFLATVSSRSTSNLAPVCPVFCGHHVYVIAASQTPKAADLAHNGQFALHAFLGENDEEFQIGGVARLVNVEEERQAVHEAVLFSSFRRSDPVFRLEPDRAVWAYWERPGQADTTQIKRTWRAHLTSVT